MFLNPALSAALDRIGDRAVDVRRAFTPGAVAQNDDVATAGPASDFTLDPLAVSASEGVYFVTRDERGEIGYTRNGSFALRDGRLVDSDGRAVCSATAPGNDLVDIRVDPVDDALGRVNEPRIERDGSFVYQRITVDPRSGLRESRRVVAGRLALARFPAGTRLATIDGSHSVAPAGVAPSFGVAGDANFPALAPMHRERSRIDVEQSLARLKEAYMAFDALAAAEAAQAHLGKTAMDLVK
jgi:flagellar basal body rod protein FlgG